MSTINRNQPVEHQPNQHMGWCGVLARNLPETPLRATSRRHTTQPSTALLTCAVVCGRGVPQGGVNHLRIDGNDGVAGSNVKQGSTERGEAGWRWDAGRMEGDYESN
jgi:hypothetical protein